MDVDILILGAGIAGLHCGIQLLQKRPSSKIVILEKYNYIGGRVVTYSKTIEGTKDSCKDVQWEIGAGRISTAHTNVLALLKRYGLHTIPLGGKMMYEDNGIVQENIFTETIRSLLPQIQQLPSSTLATKTLREVLESLLRKENANRLLLEFPYRAEVDVMRADISLESFANEFKTYEGYIVVKEGLSALMNAMAKEFQELGGLLLEGQEVTEIVPGKKIVVKTKTMSGPDVWEASKVICALHRDALAEIPLFKDWKYLDQVAMKPLVRTYAVFPVKNGRSWFSDLPKITSSGLLRFFIPVNPACGVVMISYTDEKDAKKIMSLQKKYGDKGLERIIMSECRKVFPEKTIPDPIFFKVHPWTSGCTYWLPGPYDPKKSTKDVLKPFSSDLYICGESFALRQAWMEGALEHADLLLKTYF
jgi:monoamine oxidase